MYMDDEISVIIDKRITTYLRNKRYLDIIQFEINQLLVEKMDSRIIYLDSCEINLCCQDNIIYVEMMEG